MFHDKSSEIVVALQRKEAYDEKVRYIKTIETHISTVFLTGSYAYKVKKPVKFNFLDYSSLAKRKMFCLKEVEINSHLSPDLYVGVVPIRKDKTIAIGGKGRAVEYAVKMHEIPQRYMMSRLLKKKKVDDRHIQKIAEKVVLFHRSYGATEEAKKYGGYAWVAKNCMDNFSDTQHLEGKVIPYSIFQKTQEKTLSFLEKNRGLFEERVSKGWIRATHGDLHSGNIFISDKIYIFDAVEFNPEIYCTDVAAEVAFLCMDLDLYDRRLSRLFARTYVSLSYDRRLFSLLTFYKCYRAMVRAKINGFSTKTHELAKKYFNLAAEYAGEF
jgi:aminoglycoside phosphotransferase family enzyme